MTRTIVFDVNETLTDQRVFADRFAQVGLPGAQWQAWFAATLRDGFALTMAGEPAAFRDVARSVLLGLLAAAGVEQDVDGAADHVLDGFTAIDPHDDVVPGLRALAGSGHRLVTLSNGSAGIARSMLERHGVDDCVTQVLSVEDAGAWKPHPRAYAYAAERSGTAASEVLMVAVHPWDLDGAARAGLRTVFLNRTGVPWPAVFRAPDLEVSTLPDLDEVLTRR